MSAMTSTTEVYGFEVNDADEHSTPASYAYERYIDPKHQSMAIRTVVKPDGTRETLYNGRPPKITPKNFQVTFSDDQLSDVGVRGAGADQDQSSGDGRGDRNVVIPGSLLNRLNPLKELDDAGRKEFAQRYRALQAELDDPVTRLAVMDTMGIHATVNYAGPLGIEFEFEDDIEALYANIRAVNRYLDAEWGYAYEDRIFTPPFIPMVSPEHALAELDQVLSVARPPKVIQLSTGPSIHTSPFRPDHHRFWEKVNEAGINICTHLASVTYYGRQGLEWSEPEAMLGDMDAFQWVFYYGDRPAMETVGAAILQGFFARYPNIRLLVSEQGTVWMPYLVRKMDHAYMLGRRASWGKLDRRPSEYFRQHVLVAPFPEENLDRAIEVAGVDPIVFGSDFPHGEGLPEPAAYQSQLKNLTDEQRRAVMRDNMAGFLGIG